MRIGSKNDRQVFTIQSEQHRGKTSAHARTLKMAENLNPTFVNKNMAFKN